MHDYVWLLVHSTVEFTSLGGSYSVLIYLCTAYYFLSYNHTESVML